MAPRARARRGRPPGLRLNPDALDALLRGRPQSWLAEGAGVSVSHVSELRTGKYGASNLVATRLAGFLAENDGADIRPGALFPELAALRGERFAVVEADVA